MIRNSAVSSPAVTVSSATAAAPSPVAAERQIARVRDTVHGTPLHIVLGAFSETISGAGRIERGRRIAGRAALQKASHCLIVGEVAYFSDVAGISLAAQIEAGLGGLKADGGPQQVCIPLDTMVYLCRYADSLVSSERMLAPESAEAALDDAAETVAVFPVGALSARFLERGGEQDSAALQLSGNWRNPYLFVKTGTCLLRHGMPLGRHAALLLAAFMAALALVVFIARLPSFERTLPTAQEVIAPILPVRVPANAAAALRRFNLHAVTLTAVAGRLGIRELSLSDGRMLARLGEGVSLDDDALAVRLGFRQLRAADGRLSWSAALNPPRRELPPSAAASLQSRLVALRHLPGVRVTEQRRRTLTALRLTELRLQVQGAVPFSLEQIRALMEDLPATLRSARLRYAATGLIKSVELSLAIRQAAS